MWPVVSHGDSRRDMHRTGSFFSGGTKCHGLAKAQRRRIRGPHSGPHIQSGPTHRTSRRPTLAAVVALPKQQGSTTPQTEPPPSTTPGQRAQHKTSYRCQLPVGLVVSAVRLCFPVSGVLPHPFLDGASPNRSCYAHLRSRARKTRQHHHISIWVVKFSFHLKLYMIIAP